MKLFLLALSVLTIGEYCLSGQDTLSNGNALNIPFRKYGISIGNSYEFNGIRLNFAEKNVQMINGLNLTLWSKFKFSYNKNEIVNGMSAGVISTAKEMNGINFFILGAVAEQRLNGLSIGGFGVGSGKINGLAISGMYHAGKVINGISLSGIFSFAEESFNGLAIAFTPLTEGNINGVATGVAGIYCKGTIHGITVTPGYLKAGGLEGISFSGYANIDKVQGLSIALVNNTRELHGAQVGILNFAGNNRKGLKLLPLINLHF